MDQMITDRPRQVDPLGNDDPWTMPLELMDPGNSQAVPARCALALFRAAAAGGPGALQHHQ